MSQILSFMSVTSAPSCNRFGTHTHHQHKTHITQACPDVLMYFHIGMHYTATFNLTHKIMMVLLKSTNITPIFTIIGNHGKH